MDKKQEMKYLKKCGFRSRKEFESHILEQINMLENIGLQVFNIFNNRVTEWEREYLQGKRRRNFADIMTPPRGKTIKGLERVVEKILISEEEYARWKIRPKDRRGKAPRRYDPRKLVQTMHDLIRFRIVCNYYSDARYVGSKIDQFIDDSNEFKLEKRSDHIETPFPERRRGHRALQYVLKYYVDGRRFFVEVQVMTQLQHAWDKKEHHLLYEEERRGEGEKIPVHLKNRLASMSELLYVADTVFDSLKEQITSISGE